MKSLLLHTCCAPCFLPSVEVLLGKVPWERVLEEPPDFEIFVWFYNPNITDAQEFQRRKQALLSVMAQRYPDIPVLEDESEKHREHWFSVASLLRNEPEKGKRCLFCYGYRLYRAFIKAHQCGIEAVATTLTLSPHKNTEAINAIGRVLEKRFGLLYVVSDFKKQNGMKRSQELCKYYGVYRQHYCGCEFSSRSRL
ncbi:MAG: epoxyqueuosine reductase QueH [Brevinematales bacterium]|nr:epoxyqueuosine reductase QueH [Brevinematales bacterium]